MQIISGGIQFLPPTRRRLRDAFVPRAIASLQRMPFGDAHLAASPARATLPLLGTPSLSHHQQALILNHGKFSTPFRRLCVYCDVVPAVQI